MNVRLAAQHYEEAILGCRVQFDFPVCKLLDLVPMAQEALDRGKPSAVIVLANWRHSGHART